MKSRFTPDEIKIGIAALGKNQVAESLRERLILEVNLTSGPDIDGCALSFREGRRTMAADILTLLDMPLENGRHYDTESGGQHSTHRPSGTDRRVPFEPPGGYGRGPRPTGTRRRSSPPDVDS